MLLGGAGRDRTGDLLNANQALSQLSYSPLVKKHPRPIGRAGEETSSLPYSLPILQARDSRRVDFSGRKLSLLARSRLEWNDCRRVHDRRLHPRSLRKEVIQPQVLLRLPCYDFTPIMSHTLGACLLAVSTATSSTTHFRDVTGGVYKARERIHGAVLMRHY